MYWYHIGDDFNADTALVDHGYWSGGPNADGTWGMELIHQNVHLDEVIGGIDLGSFASEAEAKAAAEQYERTH